MKIAPLLLGVALAAASTAASAADWYQVEYIIFSNQDVPGEHQEVWPPISQLPDLADAETLVPAPDDGPAQPFQVLSDTNYQLSGAWEKLQQSGHYTVLKHGGWLQPALERDAAKAVRIVQSKTPGATGTDANAPMNDPTRGSLTDAPPPKPTALELLQSPLDGLIKVTSGFYLNVKLNLVYTPDRVENGANANLQKTPVNADILGRLARGEISLEEAQRLAGAQPDASQAQNPLAESDTANTDMPKATNATPSPETVQGITLQEARRIKLNELQYFDNPRFGVLLEVSPYEGPVPTPDPNRADAAASDAPTADSQAGQ